MPLILATGVFDVLHEEHVTFLRRAKALGGILVVAIESDVRVKQLKGPERPIHPQKVRQQRLEQLGFIDRVEVLPEKFNSVEERVAFLQAIKPDILAVSSHTPHLAEKIRIMKELGGRVEIVHQHNPKVSSTLLIKQMNDSAEKKSVKQK